MKIITNQALKYNSLKEKKSQQVNQISPISLISNERSRKYKHTLLTVKELLTVLEISLGTEPLNSYWGHKPRGLRQHVVKTNYSKLLLFYTTFQNIPPF